VLSNSHPRSLLIAATCVVALVVAGCSGDDTASPTTDDTATTLVSTTSPATSPTSPSTTSPPTSTIAATTTAAATTTVPIVEPLTILVTNDDGIGAPGIDALVAALGELPDVELIVVAPAGNQSGTSDTTTPGDPADLVTTEATTLSGVPGVAVEGTPADSVNVALDVLGIEPDLVVSGVNTGQNIGTFVPLSGTVGAARTAARRGIPAIAVSAGGLERSDYATAAAIAADEVVARRDGLVADGTIVNLNVPTCAPGTEVRGVVDVAVATEFPPGTNGLDLVFDCASTAVDPTDDAVALTIGFASRSIVPADL
jgi:5'-nucleotidase